MAKAVDEMRHVVGILPNRALYRVNLATYAAYAGDFQTAEQVASSAEEQSPWALSALAIAQTGQGRVAEAADTYERLGKAEELGPSYTASGLADLALYEGRFQDSARILERGAAADLTSKNSDKAATKLVLLAYVQLLRERRESALAAADQALASSQTVSIRLLAARVFLEAGAIAKARTLAAGLAAEIQAEPQAYASIISGLLELKTGNARQAIKLLTEANVLLDTWLGHFDLGRAYLEAGGLTQADSEFDRCVKRRGEALSLFLDDEPTYGFFPPVYYYQGRVRETLRTSGFAESYRSYLRIRGQSSEDPMVQHLRRAGF
jgi:tetratricopeptide (TPR) repeat protein